MTPRYKTAITATLALLVAGALAPQAQASGFQLREQSPSAQGNAFAGVSAGGSDISSMFFNPATMTQFEGFQVFVGFSSVAPKAELSGASATRASLTAFGPLGAFGGTTITGPTAYPNSAKSAVLPNIYAMWSVSKDFKLGLSVNAPFGMVTEYDSSFVGRYHALKSDLKVVDVALNAAYRFNPMFSVGASVVYRKVNAELSNAVDMGQIAFLGLAQLYPTSPAVFGPFAPSSTTSAFDGKATVKGDTSLMAYKLGLTFEPSKELRFGLGYQSSTKPKVEGTVTYDMPVVAAGQAPYFNAVMGAAHLVNGTATAEVDLPDTTSLGISWDLAPTVNLSAEVAKTGWSKFKDLTVKFGSGQSDSTTHENWRDTMFCSLGATWKASEALTLRVGLASDQGAVEDGYRTPRIPDGDRTWFSGGLSYAFTKSFGVDLAYTHIVVKDGPLALTAGASPAGADFFRGNLSGTFKNGIEIVALSARFNF